MGTTRAAVATAFGKPLEIREVPIPDLEPGGIIARVDAATLCGSDVHWWHGGPPAVAQPPYIPGHETAGIIEEMRGSRSDLLGMPLRPGDRVIWTYSFCGHCYYCAVAAQPTLCADSVRFGRARCDQPPFLLGGLAAHHYVPPGSQVIRVPEEVSSPLAASAACALRTVMHGFDRLGAIASHETVVVQGCGPVGLYATAVARDRGAARVIVIGAPAARLEVAAAWGASETINLEDVPEEAARKQLVVDGTGGRGPDIVIQCANSAAAREGLEFIRPGGRFVSIGAGGGAGSVSIDVLGKHLSFVSVRTAEARHFYQGLVFLATRKHIPFDMLLSGVYPLERATDALEAMASLREVKAVILPHG